MVINYIKIRFAFQRLFKEMFVGKVLFDNVITAGSEAVFKFIEDNAIGFIFNDLVLVTEYAGDVKSGSCIYNKYTKKKLSAWDIEALQYRIYPGGKEQRDGEQ